jgi:hypothetical protein
MVFWIRRRFIIHHDCLSIERRPLSLETQIQYTRDILLSTAVVILEEQIDARGAVPFGAVERHFNHFVATGEGEGLRWWKVGGGGEVEGVAVSVEVDCLGGGGGVGGAEEEGEEFHGAGESEWILARGDVLEWKKEDHGMCIIICSSSSLLASSGVGSWR